MKFGYLRQDDDSHWYLVPENEIEEFDALMEKMYNSWNNMDIVKEFNRKFWKYVLGESPKNLKVLIEE